MFQTSQRIRYDRTPDDERLMMERMQELRTLPSCNQCFQPVPGLFAKQGVSEVRSMARTDVESRLLRLGKPLQHGGNEAAPMPCIDACESANGDACPLPGAACAEQWALRHFHECALPSEDTRTTHPPCKYREMTVDRFDPLCRDPQNLSYILHPGEINISYRLVAKDNHRPCIPKPMDPTPLLPKDVPFTAPALCPDAPEIKQSFIGSLRPWRHTQDLDVAFGRKEAPPFYYQYACNQMDSAAAAATPGCTPFGAAPIGSGADAPAAWEPMPLGNVAQAQW